jgi:hypothetical protein
VPSRERAHRARGELATQLGGQHRQQDPARVQAARGGGDEADSEDPVADQLGVLLGEGDDRHAAHRVPHEDDRALGHDVLEHRCEVAPELVDRGVVLERAPRASVRALVVVDGADQASVGRALEVPAVEVECVAVAEHDRERAGRPAARGIELVDLDVEGHTVVGDHGHRRRVQAAERRDVALAAVDGPALAPDAERRAGRGHTHRAGRGSEDPTAGAHLVILSLSMWRLRNRPPIRVTIS